MNFKSWIKKSEKFFEKNGTPLVSDNAKAIILGRPSARQYDILENSKYKDNFVVVSSLAFLPEKGIVAAYCLEDYTYNKSFIKKVKDRIRECSNGVCKVIYAEERLFGFIV